MYLPRMPISQVLLSWVGQSRPVQLIKIDAQGADLSIVQSGGGALRRVRYVQLEVVSDDVSHGCSRPRLPPPRRQLHAAL